MQWLALNLRTMGDATSLLIDRWGAPFEISESVVVLRPRLLQVSGGGRLAGSSVPKELRVSKTLLNAQSKIPFLVQMTFWSEEVQ
jgi:hypothetical protein